MQKIEIVLATHGENLSWAEGLESVITEYATTCGIDVGKRMSEHNLVISRKQRFYKPDYKILNHVRRGNLATVSQMADAHNLATLECLTRELADVVSDGKSVLRQLAAFIHKDLHGHRKRYIENNVNLCESNHFLHHIITRYDELADITVFSQGAAHEHCDNFAHLVLSNIQSDFSLLPNRGYYCRPTDWRRLQDLSEQTGGGYNGYYLKSLALQFWEKLTGRPLSFPTPWTAGGAFMATRSLIRSNPKSWYESVYEIATQFKDSGYAIERLWASIINPKIQESEEGGFQVVITTFNNSNSIHACLQSVYKQMLHRNWVLIGYDNASIDGTYDIMSRWSTHPQNSVEDCGFLFEFGKAEIKQRPEQARLNAERLGQRFLPTHPSVIHVDGNALMSNGL